MGQVVRYAILFAYLAACSAPPPKPDFDSKRVVAAFAASCERSGYPRGTAEHARCLIDLVNKAFPPPVERPSTTVTCDRDPLGSVTCTTH